MCACRRESLLVRQKTASSLQHPYGNHDHEQDRAKAALKSAQLAYGMSATEFAVQSSSRSRSRRGRGRFSAVANAVDGNAQGPSPGSPGGDLISFEDLEDSDAQRLRSVFPAPASSVGSPVSS